MSSNKNITNSFYPYFMSLFCAIIILGNIYALKIITIFSLRTPSGMICFPFSFSINNIITEVYGEEAATKTIRFGMIILILYYLTLLFITGIDPAPGWNSQKEWEKIFSSSPLIVLGTLCAYYSSEKINSKILSIFKYYFEGKYFLGRSVGATIIGVTLDTLIFNVIAFYWFLPFYDWVFFTLDQIALKIFFEIIGSIISSLVIPSLKNYEDLDPVKPRAWIDKFRRIN